jgi:hypothetical protein
VSGYLWLLAIQQNGGARRFSPDGKNSDFLNQSSSLWAVTGDERIDLLIPLFQLCQAVARSGRENYSERDFARFVDQRNSGARWGTAAIDLPADAFGRTDPCLQLATSRPGRCRGSCFWRQSDDSVAGQVQHASPRGEGFGSLPAKLGLDAAVAHWVARFDGTETMETLLKQLASRQKGSAGPGDSRGSAGD